MQLLLFNNQQNQGAGNMATGAAWTSGTYSVSNFRQYFINGSLPSSDTWGLNTTRLNSLESTYQMFYCDANFNNDYVPNGWARSIHPGVRLNLGSHEFVDFNSQLGGKTLTIYPNLLNSNIAMASPRIVEWKVVFPVSVNNTSLDLPIVSCRYIAVPVVGGGSFCGGRNFDIASVGFCFEFHDSIPSCSDLRSSGANQLIDILLDGDFISGNPVNFSYSLGFNTPSADSLNSVSVPAGSIRQFTSLRSVNAEFVGGVVRDTGYIKLYGTIVGCGIAVAGGTADINNYDDEIEICNIGFSPCEDKASSITLSYNNNLDSLITVDEYTAYVYISRIEWYGFKALTDYCCDDSSVVPVDGESFPPNSTEGGSSGGGGDVDITCICNGLTSLNTTLANKLDALSDKLDLINDTIEDKDLSLTLDSCVCDNLSDIADNVSAVADSIDNKVLPSSTDVSGIVTAIQQKVIPVTDVSGVSSAIANKVIPVTDVSGVSSAIANKVIPVTDVSGVVTGLDNIDSSLLGIDGTIAGGTVDITTSISDIDTTLGLINTSVGDVSDAVSNVSLDSSSLSCVDDEGNEVGIACILKNALNNRDSKGLADVIEDKEVGGFTDVTIEPYDLVNIRRAFRDDNNNE